MTGAPAPRAPKDRPPSKRAPARRSGRPQSDADYYAKVGFAVLALVAAMGLVQRDGARWVDTADTWAREQAARAGIGGVPDGVRAVVDATEVTKAAAQLATLPTARGGATVYHRAAFGPAWADVDHNGCDTRDDILARDMEDVQRHGKCVVVSGTLHDPYTGKTITWAKAHATAVQIDHVVPLNEAWRSGAWTWAPDRREEFANDPRNLLAVDGPENERKGDSDPAEWLPPDKGYVCTYVVRYVTVKAAYGLAVDRAERTALTHTLANCS